MAKKRAASPKSLPGRKRPKKPKSSGELEEESNSTGPSTSIEAGEESPGSDSETSDGNDVDDFAESDDEDCDDINVDDDDEEAHVDNTDDDESSVEELEQQTNLPMAKKPPVKKSRPPREIDSSRPPITSIEDIFMELTKTALENGLVNFTHVMGGRALRVGTACSGTESPILALQMISSALMRLGKTPIHFNHVFSAEIEPYKQAYIERNFRPPILFRDITEWSTARDAYFEEHRPLAELTATTAYGNEVPIPGDLDILIAGCSCVDYSHLNNNRADTGKMKSAGESRATFDAILHYAELFTPKLIILENVKGAPWKAMAEALRRVDYILFWGSFDTKDYFLPHTRNRGYAFAIPRRTTGATDSNALSTAGDTWQKTMNNLKRPASSPASHFVLPLDDPRVQRLLAQDRDANVTKWEVCRDRHEDARIQDKLGPKRPYTNWNEAGGCKGPDFGHDRHLLNRSERVKDLLDITLLRKTSAQSNSFDPRFKSRVFELSQNVHMFKDSTPMGIAPCQTPNGMPFMSDRGAPLSGLDSLILQGIPIDRVIFTIEGNKHLQNLAGNAMSSTVIGAAIISALVSTYEYCRFADRKECSGASAIDFSPRRIVLSTSAWVPGGQAPCVSKKETDPLRQDEILQMAAPSERLCYCEGRWNLASHAMVRCKDCNHSVCIGCGGNPPHRYQAENRLRQLPEDFLKQLRQLFPPLIRLDGSVAEVDFDEAAPSTSSGLSTCFEEVKKQLKIPFRLQDFIRGPSWTIRYESQHAILECALVAPPEWRLYLKPHPDLSMEAEIRQAMVTPMVLGLTKEFNIFNVGWIFLCPKEVASDLSITGSGNLIPSFRNRLGLVNFADEYVYDTLEIQMIANGDAECVDAPHDVSGIYRALPDCGQAENSLYQRVEPLSGNGTHPVCLFLDPERNKSPKSDCFVFSRDLTRYDGAHRRQLMGRLGADWRLPHYKCQTGDPALTSMARLFQKREIRLPRLNLELKIPSTELVSPFTQPGPRLPYTPNDCGLAMMVYRLTSQLPPEMRSHFGQSSSIEPNDASFFHDFAWLVEIGRAMRFNSVWVDANINLDSGNCRACAPKRPDIKWKLRTIVKKTEITHCVPYEEPHSAATYERQVKQRPIVFAIKMHVSSTGGADLRFGVNIASLAHRAWSNLQAVSYGWQTSPRVEFRLNVDFTPHRDPVLPRYSLRDNSTDTPFAGNLGFNTPRGGRQLDLNDLQRRSLTWMMNREADKVTPFVLKEFDESPLVHMRWLAEVCVHRSARIRGGVVADRVSYGKTVTSLALIHAEFHNRSFSTVGFSEQDSVLPFTRATLIVVPGSLMGQWPSEVAKFLPKNEYVRHHTLLIIKTVEDLENLSFQDFQKAKIIIASIKIFQTCKPDKDRQTAGTCEQEQKTPYSRPLARFVGGFDPHPAATSDRPFSAWLDDTTGRLSESITRLARDGPRRFMKDNADRARKLDRDPDYQNFIPSKRLRGAAYAEQAGKRKGKAPEKVEHSEDDTTSSDESDEDAIEDWRTMTGAPLFHLFRFNRLIIDEFSYLGPLEHHYLKNIQATKKWILSGTPNLETTYHVQRVAELIGVYLGQEISTEAALSPGTHANLRSDWTDIEEFHSFREVNSPNWKEARHAHAQYFLDTFTRRNDARLDCVIECVEHLRPLHLNPEHLVIYMELTQVCILRNMLPKKEAKGSIGSREHQINVALRNKSVPEALLTSACYQQGVKYGTLLGKLLDIRVKEKQAARSGLVTCLKKCEYFDRQVGGLSKFGEWKSRQRGSDSPLKDHDVAREMREMIAQAEADPGEFPDNALLNGKKVKGKFCGSGKKDPRVAPINSLVNEATSSAHVYVKRVRSLRYLRTVQSILHAFRHQHILECRAHGCAQPHQFPAAMSLVTECGHPVCTTCLASRPSQFACPVLGCGVFIRRESILSATALNDGPTPTGATYGTKLDTIMNDLDDEQTVGRDEQAVLFVQNSDLLKLVNAAFQSKKERTAKSNRPFEFVIGSTVKNVEDFKTNRSIKVMVLNLTSVAAAGLNLTNANHVMFLSPLLIPTRHEYEAALTQAIGRSRRYGQMKTVHVWRYVALRTIDIDIVEQRERRTFSLSSAAPSGYIPVEWTRDYAGTLKERCLFVRRGAHFAIMPSRARRSQPNNLTAEQRESFTSLVKFSKEYVD